MLSPPAEVRGDLPAKGYDIHCPLMGDSGINYLASSCLGRLANRSCRMKGCPRYRAVVGPKPAVKVPALAVMEDWKVEPDAPVMSKPRQEEAMSTTGQEASVGRGRKGSGGPTKHKVGPCANPACGRVMPLSGRGLCGKCYSAVLKTEKGGEGLRRERRQDTAPPRTPSGAGRELQIVITFAGEDKGLLEKLTEQAQRERRSVENQVLFLLEDLLASAGPVK